MAWHIVFTEGDLKGRTFDLRTQEVLLGRDSVCNIRIPARDVSRHHLVLKMTDEGIELTNSSSQRDATYVGTSVVPQNHRTKLQVGDRIIIGTKKSTVFVLEQGEAKTFEGQVTGDLTGTNAQPGGTGTLPGGTGTFPNGTGTFPGGNGATMGTVGTTHSPENDDNGGDKTRRIETIQVDPADIQKLIEELIAARKRKVLWRVVSFVLAFFVVAIIYYWFQPRPEKVLTWPRRVNGNFDVQSVQLETPLGAKTLWLSVPGGPYLTSAKDTNGVVSVTTRLGKQRDVPYWITFSCECDTNVVTQSRHAIFERKKRELAATGNWNFQVSTPLAFLGKGNGLPYLGAQYLRSVRNGTETEQRYGHLLFAVWGDCKLTLLREIPSMEQWRGGAVLAAAPLLTVEQRALDVRWEGRPDFRDEPVESMLSEADALLASKASMCWQEVEFLLQSVLVKSVLQTGGGQKTRERALERLRDLRQKEQREYFRLKGEWEKCKRLGDHGGCRNALEEALKIFSMPDDKRNAFFLKGGWK